MSETFDIAVKISPGQTVTTIDQLEKKLAAAEKETKLLNAELKQTAHNVIAVQRAQAQQASQTIGLPSVPKGKGADFSGAMSMGKQMLGVAGAVGAGLAAIDHAVEQYHALEDRVTELTNKATKFTSEFKSANDVIREQAALGHELHTTAAGVIGVFDSVGDATERLNLTTAEQTRLTALLGKGAQLGGKSIESIGDRIQALSSAFETGGDAGRVLRSLFRDFNEVGNDLASTLGMTKEQIVNMASNGQLSFEQLVNALLKGGGQIEASHAKIQKTHAQQTAQFTEGYERSMAAGNGWADSITAGIDQVEGRLKKNTQTFNQWAENLVQQQQKILAQAEQAGSAQAARGIFDTVDALGDLLDTGQNYFNVATNAAGVTDQWRVAGERNTKAIVDQTDALEELARRQREAYLADNAFIRAQRERFEEGFTSGTEIAPMDLGGLRDPSMNDPRFAAESAYQSSIDFNEQTVSAAEDASARVKEAWAAGFGSIGANIIQMAAEGKASTAEMVNEMLMQLAKLALQQAAMQAGGPYGAFLGALVGGFAHGGRVTVGPGWSSLPTAANGNTWSVGGGGSTTADDRLFMARVSTGEDITVRTRQQQLAESQWQARAQQAMGGGGRSGANVTNQIVVRSDPREVTRAMGSRSGQTEFVALNRQFSRRR